MVVTVSLPKASASNEAVAVRETLDQEGTSYETLQVAPSASTAIMAMSQELSMLQGARVLLVEDDFFIGLEYVEHLTRWGVKIIGPAISDAEARKLLVGVQIDAALLDVSIQGGDSFALAQDLHEAKTPFAFITAYASDAKMFPEPLKTAVRLGKPVHESQLNALLTTLLAGRAD